MGSKNKIAKYLLPIMSRVRGNRVWVEPFVGGANLIDKVNSKRIGNNIHPYLIALLKSLQIGWAPPTNISKEKYYDIKNPPNRYGAGFECVLAVNIRTILNKNSQNSRTEKLFKFQSNDS